MRCPFCNDPEEKVDVIDSRTCENGRAIRRRRKCNHCNRRFTTYERVEQTVRLAVVKRDGRRVPWDKQKMLDGLKRACYKRAVPDSELQRLADEVEEDVFTTFDREVPSKAIGQVVADKLRRVDQVAYVRFASVYRQFKTLEELVDEAKAVLDARRFEDPHQGQLFVEGKPEGASAGLGGVGATAAGANGSGAATGSGQELPAVRRGRGRRPKAAAPQ